ncbi:MAG: S-methyl-5-thioribose-1-phosphate isomerase [Methanomicrobiales archaeon]|nr:S-methyl-5-thioribose-1-phosphate isomerase [Methanomicrobiales archaeon]
MPEAPEPTISWDQGSGTIRFIDQTLLPERYAMVTCGTVKRLIRGISRLEVRGAPALGVAGGMGVALAAVKSRATRRDDFLREVEEAAGSVAATRPTAVNLSWGVNRVLDRVREAADPAEARRVAVEEAVAMAEEDRTTCLRIGENGVAIVPDGATILTHCNAGALACTEWGTALGVVRSAARAGKRVKVIACETRPLFQGSRLTAWELSRDGIDVTVIPDGSAAFLMRKGEISLVLVGADRITRDAVFNKIGTYMHAVCARHHNIPFYVAAPRSTFDLGLTEGEVTIEERERSEVSRCGGRTLVPDGAGVRNLGFDATPLSLVSAIITEDGVLRPPYRLGGQAPV